VGLGGGVWWHGQLHGKLSTLSGVCGTESGGVCPAAADTTSGSVSVVEWRASPTVGKFRETMPRAVQVSRLRNSMSASLVT